MLGAMNARLRFSNARWLLVAGLAMAGQSAVSFAVERPQIAIASFSVDVTPPEGHPLCGGWIKPLEAVDDPLLAKGVVLESKRDRYVICVLDWCLLQTKAHDAFIGALAGAAGVPASQVTVHTVHQHNAPIADSRAQELLNQSPGALSLVDLPFLESAIARVAEAVRLACQRTEPVTHLGYGQGRVEQFASNRRVRMADNAIHVRYSSTTDPAMRAAPEGLIDPWLRTVSFYQDDRPLVRMHYYASHPMSFYGDGRATSDTVGLARRRLEREEGVPSLYFTGCAGNITAGKYNDGSPAAREALTGRIYDAMKQAITASSRAPVPDLSWRSLKVRFAPRPGAPWSAAAARSTLADTNATAQARLVASLNLAWAERITANPTLTLSCLRLGPVSILHLPGESFLEYQLYAQSLDPGRFVAVAAYGESGPGYICCDAALAEGGYEPTMSRVGPPSEVDYKRGIASLLDPAPSTAVPFYPDKLRLLWERDRHGRDRPVTGPREWQARRRDILAAMEQVMGPRPARRGGDLRVDEAVLGERFTRFHLTWAAGDGDRVPAYLFVPHPDGTRRPAMLCLHQTTPHGKAEPAGLAGNPDLHYALELAERGYVTLAPDYPGYGEYEFDPYAHGYASATMKGIVNHRQAVELLGARADVDPQRIGVIGHSLGGHNALFLAAMEPRVRAVITSCGFNSFFKYQGGDLAGWSHPGYMPRIRDRYGSDPKQVPFDFTEIIAAIAPRPRAVVSPLPISSWAG